MKQAPKKQALKTVGIIVLSSMASGAERRATSLAHSALSHYTANREIHLIISELLYAALIQQPDSVIALEALETASRLHVLPEPPKSLPGKAQVLIELTQAIRTVLRNNIRVLHTFLGALPIAFFMRFWKMPTIFEVTSPDIVQKLKRPQNRLFVNSYTALNCVSPSVARRLRELGLRPKINEAPIPFFQPKAPSKQTIPRENLIVFASRFIPRKNAVLFCRAAIRFVLANPDWRVAILGKGPTANKIQAELDAHGNPRNILVKYSDDVRAHLRKAKIFVSLIEPDNYPSQSVLEAMDEGLALLLAKTGDSNLFLSKEKPNGILCELTEDAILEGIKYLARNLPHLKEMGLSSKILLSKRFAPEIYQEWLANTYREIS